MADVFKRAAALKLTRIMAVISLSIIMTLTYLLSTLHSPVISLTESTSQSPENAWRVYTAGNTPENKMLSKEQPITIVTAYWNIGSITNGNINQSKDPARYLRYMHSFAYIENPVVAYFDDIIMEMQFLLIRKRARFPTKTILFKNRTELWSFSLESHLQEIHSQPGYPKSIPVFHTSYDVAMHAKYDTMTHAIKNNYFNTEYFAWCDLGIFRDMPGGLGSHYNFRMTLPPEFDREKVAFSQVTPRDDKLGLKDIFFGSRFWVAGGFFLGTTEPLLKLAEDYRYSTEKFLRMNLSATDQQVIYAMYSRFNQDVPQVEIQTYITDGTTTDLWMFLGELLRQIWWNNHPIPDDCHNCNRSELIPFFE